MSKKIQLSIATPCHENWDNMNPVEKGRFCGSCQKQVVDFSRMSDREIAQFFKKPSTGSVCGRFMEDQLERDMMIPKKRIPWLKYFFQFLLPAFLISMKATAQGKVKIIAQKVAPAATCTRTMGLVAPVQVKKIKADSLIVPVPKTRKESESFIMGDIAIADPRKQKKIEDTITLKEVIVTSYTSYIKGRVSTGSVTIVAGETKKNDSSSVLLQHQLKRIIKNIMPENFKVFPNPVTAGTDLHIEWKQNETGNYVLQLLNQSGQLAYTKDMWVDEDARLLELQVPPVAAGVYFLRMTNKISGKTFSEKIIIE